MGMRAETNSRYVQKIEATAGVCCLVMGLVAPLLGGLLTGIEWLLGMGQHPWIHVASTSFFIVGIPLILLAGFCLDWAEKAQSAP